MLQGPGWCTGTVSHASLQVPCGRREGSALKQKHYRNSVDVGNGSWFFFKCSVKANQQQGKGSDKPK